MFICRVVVVSVNNEDEPILESFFSRMRYFIATRARVMGNAEENVQERVMREDATVTLPGFANASNRALASRIEVRENVLDAKQTHRGLTEDGVVFVFVFAQ